MANILDRGFAMADFPRSLIEFQRRFPDEKACAAYLAEARWPNGFRCPDCGHDKGWELATKAFTWECALCGKQTSVTAGTVMHASKLPLTAWFWAAYLMTTHSNGIAALQLQKQLGLGSYKSAWLLCGKQRRGQDAGRRRRRSARRRTRPGAARRHILLLRRKPARLHRGQCRRRRHRQDRRLARLRRRAWRRPRSARHRPDGRPCRAPLDPSDVLEPQTLGLGRLPWPAPQAPAILPRRIRLPLQPPPHPTCRLPVAARDRRRPQTRHLQDADHTGSNGISLIDHSSGHVSIFLLILSKTRQIYAIDNPRILQKFFDIVVVVRVHRPFDAP